MLCQLHIPAETLQHVPILVRRQPSVEYGLQSLANPRLLRPPLVQYMHPHDAELLTDVKGSAWTDSDTEEKNISITIYCWIHKV